MKVLSRQRKVLLSVLLAIVLALSVGAAFWAAPDVKAEATLSDAEFASVYLMGTELEIPEGKLTYGGEEKAAEARIRFPGGTWYALDRAVLSEEGKYVVEYSAKFGDVNASATREFNAVKSLYEVSGSSTAEYVPIPTPRIPKGSLYPSPTATYSAITSPSILPAPSKTTIFCPSSTRCRRRAKRTRASSSSLLRTYTMKKTISPSYSRRRTSWNRAMTIGCF